MRNWTFLLLIVTGCQQAPDHHQKQHQLEAAATAAAHPQISQTAPLMPRPDEPTQTAIRYFTWYKHNQDRINQVSQDYFIDNDEGLDTTKFMVVDYLKAEEYLATLQSSGCVSEAYVAAGRRYIRQWGDSLLAHPQFEGAPEGFDADLVLSSQDGDDYLNNIGQAPKTVRYPAPNRAVVRAEYSTRPGWSAQQVFYLTRYASGWLIDSIALK
jgi:hypothetical protein